MGRPRQASSEAEAAGAGKPWASPCTQRTRRLLHAWRNSEGCSPPAVPPRVHLERKEVPEGERGLISLLRWKEDTQTRGSLSTRVHADTLLSDSTVEQGPALCCGFLWAQISLLFGLWAKLRILIIMAQGHGDLSVCVPWGTVLRIRIMPSVASLLSKTYSVPGPAQTLGRQ